MNRRQFIQSTALAAIVGGSIQANQIPNILAYEINRLIVLDSYPDGNMSLMIKITYSDGSFEGYRSIVKDEFVIELLKELFGENSCISGTEAVVYNNSLYCKHGGNGIILDNLQKIDLDRFLNSARVQRLLNE